MAIYLYGGTPDSYVEDRESGDRMAGVELTVLDALSESPVAGLMTGTGLPASSIFTDANGYFALMCESPSIVLRVTDSQGTTTWGPLTSAVAVRDVVLASAALLSDVTAAGSGATPAGYALTADGGGGTQWAEVVGTGGGTADSVAWDDVTGKPATFPATTHTHTASQVSDATTLGRSLMTAASAAAARSAIGAAATGPISYDALPAGSVLTVMESAGTYTRPTARADLCVIFTGASDPGSVAVDGDKWDQTA